MTDPARHVASEIRFEVRVTNGPRTVRIRDVDHSVSAVEDVVVLVRMTLVKGRSVDEKIVGVLGSAWKSDPSEFMILRNFLTSGGIIIGIHKDIS